MRGTANADEWCVVISGVMDKERRYKTTRCVFLMSQKGRTWWEAKRKKANKRLRSPSRAKGARRWEAKTKTRAAVFIIQTRARHDDDTLGRKIYDEMWEATKERGARDDEDEKISSSVLDSRWFFLLPISRAAVTTRRRCDKPGGGFQSWKSFHFFSVLRENTSTFECMAGKCKKLKYLALFFFFLVFLSPPFSFFTSLFILWMKEFRNWETSMLEGSDWLNKSVGNRVKSFFFSRRDEKIPTKMGIKFLYMFRADSSPGIYNLVEPVVTLYGWGKKVVIYWQSFSFEDPSFTVVDS